MVKIKFQDAKKDQMNKIFVDNITRITTIDNLCVMYRLKDYENDKKVNLSNINNTVIFL